MSKTATLLLFLYALRKFFGQSQVDGRTKMQKIVYLTSRKNNVLPFKFKGYHYGPYSKELQNTLGRMTAFNLIEENISSFGPRIKYFYELTEEGFRKAREVWERLDPEFKDRIEKAAEEGSKYNDFTLDELLPQAYRIAESEGIL